VPGREARTTIRAEARRERATTRQAVPFYVASALISATALVALLWVWTGALNAPPMSAAGDVLLVSEADIGQYEERTAGPLTVADTAPAFIPTGIFVEAVRFDGPYTVVASGFVWQRYADELPDDLAAGIVMPQAETATYKETYRTHQDGETVVGWSFSVKLRQQFDYSDYPFDRQQIWFELWHVEFARDVYLTPDAASYSSLVPTSRPGLDDDVVLEGWDIPGSYFAYRMARYNASFGVQGYVGEEPQTELRFAIELERSLWDAIPGNVLPPLIILLELFLLVAVLGRSRERFEAFGVRPGAVIFTCTAIFLSVLVIHNDLRNRLEASSIVYAETIYLLLYVVILGVAANSVLLVSKPDLTLFRERENLWAIVGFWPVILVVLLIITVIALA
jgi:hypothetical protein